MSEESPFLKTDVAAAQLKQWDRFLLRGVRKVANKG